MEINSKVASLDFKKVSGRIIRVKRWTIMKVSLVKAAKYLTLIVLAGIVLLVGTFLYLYVPNPAKITDPYHPWFNPDNFRFEDYMVTRCVEKEVLAKLFPVGTEKLFVDRVLVDAGGARIKQTPYRRDSFGKILEEGLNKFSYFYEPRHWSNWFFPNTWNVSVMYDADNKVTDVRIPGGQHGESVYDFWSYCTIGKKYGRNWNR
jgi:hypothetical protein